MKSKDSNNNHYLYLTLTAGICIGSAVALTKWWRGKAHNDNNNKTLPPEIRHEQLSRHTLYFGPDGMKKLANSRVCIVGVGGVGSHTALMLARGGIGFLRLIDFDQVTVSSLNRHACAVLADVGIPKVVCMKRYIHAVCPDERMLRVDARVEMVTAQSVEELLRLDNDDNEKKKWDMVIDAIDDTSTKAALLRYCICHNIRVVSCMGAGGKADFTRLQLSDLRTASKDPLATKLRNELKRVFRQDTSGTSDAGMTKRGKRDNDDQLHWYLDDMEALTILYNSQKTVVQLAEFTEEQKQQGIEHFGAVDGMRIRILPVLGTMPAIMGQALAGFCLTQVGEKPFQGVTAERVGRKSRNHLYQIANTRERKLETLILEQVGQAVVDVDDDMVVKDGVIVNWPSAEERTWIGPLQFDIDDVEYLMEVWRHRCGVTNAKIGTVMHLIRWDMSKPSTCNNMVMVCANALNQYEDKVRGGLQKGKLPEYVRERIEKRLFMTLTDPYGELL